MTYECEECKEKVEKISDLNVYNIKYGIKLVCSNCYKKLKKEQLIYGCSECKKYWKPTIDENSWNYIKINEIRNILFSTNVCPKCNRKNRLYKLTNI